jgi:type IV secretory pathway VirB10-like protein
MSIMSPAESPQGLLPSSNGFGITRINRKIVGLVLIIFGGAAIALIAAINTRGNKRNDTAADTLKQGKADVASVPDFQSAQRSQAAGTTASPGFIGTVKGVFTGSPSEQAVSDPELLKEQAEFAKEVRRYEHQQHMQKLTRRDAALTAGMEARGVSPALVDSRNPDIQAEQEAAAATVQRLPNGQLALGGDVSTGESPIDRDPNLQARKESFYGQERLSGYLPNRKQAPLSPYEIKQGTVIPMILVSGINSDLPGEIIAQVSQNVYDSVTGEHLLIPQGTKSIGTYDSFVAIGQERAMLAWRRMIFPDGMSLDILNMPGADQGGYAGFKDQVNNHYFRIFGGAIMMSFLGAGFQLTQPRSEGQFPSAREIIAAETGRNIAQVGVELARRDMRIQPTIEIRPGYRFNIIVNRDMVLEPYTE